MTEQEIFNEAYLGLKGQGFQLSRTDTPSGFGVRCMYRGPNGLKCAVGHLISDDDYNPLFEGAPALDLPLISAHFGAYRKLIQSLQAAHDGNAYHYAGEHILRTVNMTPDLLEQRLSAVAAAFGLKIPVDIRPGA